MAYSWARKVCIFQFTWVPSCFRLFMVLRILLNYFLRHFIFWECSLVYAPFVTWPPGGCLLITSQNSIAATCDWTTLYKPACTGSVNSYFCAPCFDEDVESSVCSCVAWMWLKKRKYFVPFVAILRRSIFAHFAGLLPVSFLTAGSVLIFLNGCIFSRFHERRNLLIFH